MSRTRKRPYRIVVDGPRGKITLSIAADKWGPKYLRAFRTAERAIVAAVVASKGASLPTTEPTP